MTQGTALLIPSILMGYDTRQSSTWIGADKVPGDTARIMLPKTPPAPRPIEKPLDLGSAVSDQETGGPVVALRSAVTHHLARVPASKSLEEKLFDTRVNLKVATSHFAMHLDSLARERLFAEVDYLLAEEGWDPDDDLPTVQSYRIFLKWLVFSKDATWSSLGIADDGNILVAWVRDADIMTANFGERIRWTQRFVANGSRQTASGDFSLEHFARQASNFLSGF